MTLVCGCPVEEILEFVREAIRLNATLEAAVILRDDDPSGTRPLVARTSWERMDISLVVAEGDAAMQRFIFSHLINRQLSSVGGSILWMGWARTGGPKLFLSGGIGFMRAVWIEVAQFLCGDKGLYQCDACERFIAVRAENRKSANTNTARTVGAMTLNTSGGKGKNVLRSRSPRWQTTYHRSDAVSVLLASAMVVCVLLSPSISR
jgi:hypothetical protein